MSRCMRRDQKVRTCLSKFWVSCSGTKLIRRTCWLQHQRTWWVDRSRSCTLSPSALRSASVVAIFWKRCVVFSMVVCSPKTTGLGSVSSWICRCPPKQLSVSVTLSWNSGGMGSWQEPFNTCVLVDCRAASQTRTTLLPWAPLLHVGILSFMSSSDPQTLPWEINTPDISPFDIPRKSLTMTLEIWWSNLYRQSGRSVTQFSICAHLWLETYPFSIMIILQDACVIHRYQTMINSILSKISSSSQ